MLYLYLFIFKVVFVFAFAQTDVATDNLSGGEFAIIQDVNITEFNVTEENNGTSLPTTPNDVDIGILTSTISLHKEIIISEDNKIWPIFQNLPYVFTNASVGNDLYRDILVTSSNSDEGGKIVLKCDKETTPEACKKFSIKTENVDEGEFRGVIQLQEGLDFDTTSTYILPIKAEYLDTNERERHVASAIVVIEVTDEQDLGPQFGSEIYYVDVQEESAEEKVVLSLDVYDADRGNPRALLISLENDLRGFFQIGQIQNDTRGNYFVEISTTGKPIDREEHEILWNGGFYVFQIRATEMENGKPNDISATADIWVNVLDINDNPPVFDRSNVTINLAENFTVDLPLPTFYLHVTDLDIDENGRFTLTLVSERFGFENLFEIEPLSAENSVPVTLKINKFARLDYEDPLQREMNFSITASDNSGHSSSVNVTILLRDANDNGPIFEQTEYTAHVTIQNISSSLVAIVNATDRDSGQFGRVEYEILGEESQQFYVSPENGSVFMLQCPDLCSPQTHHLVLKASDIGGKFALSSLTIFTELSVPNVTSSEETTTVKINFTNSVVNTTIREITKEGTVVARLSATSSDPETRVLYSLLSGAEGNFVIDPTEGILRVAPGAILDIDRTKLKNYNITIGTGPASSNEISDVAHTYITIEDVNNKPPKFDDRFYVVHMDRAKSEGDEIFEVFALDPDQGANLKYSFGQNIILHGKDGNVSADSLGINDVLQINSSTGVIVLLRPLSDYFMALFRVTVEDVAAQTPGQSDSGTCKTEIIIFITGSENELAWELPHSVIELNVSEDVEIGSQIIVLGGLASPKRNDLVFEKIKNSDPNNYFDVNPISGSLTTQKSIDYESFSEHNKKLEVEITVLLSGRDIGNVSVSLNILDINDNRPSFSQSSYVVSVTESVEEEVECLNLTARDDDDEKFGEIVYRLSGENNFFDVNEMGTLYKKSGVLLDRETEPFHYLRVLAIDNPKDTKNQQTGQTTVQIIVRDLNDNPPKFSRNLYTVIIPENLPLHSPFFEVRANDADIGNNSVVKYSITNPKQITELFGIDEESGILYANRSLSATGRSFPYQLRIKATDSGTPSLSSTCEIEVHVGDLSVQDELPRFIFPPKGETIYVVESDKEDLTVCQVELSKPDRFKNMKSVVRFSLLDLGYGGSIRRFFTINTDTGLITTRRPLDRELEENYTLVVAATQVGPYMPQAYHIVHVSVTDVNDNVPYFPRPVNSDPLEMKVLEESDPGTTVGIIEAVDRDKGENAVMSYSILGLGSEELFGINNTGDGKAVIYVKDRLDHEKQTFYDLVIGVRNPSIAKSIDRDDLYDPRDLSKLSIRVNLIDIDDNDIQFVSPTDNLGVRLNAPRQSIVTTIQAYDPDASDNPLQYYIEKVTFQKDGQDETNVYEEMFFLEKDSGVLRTAQSLSNYEDGTFHLVISGRSARKSTLFQETKFEIKVLHDSHMLKFVFQKPPIEVQRELRNMNRDFQTVAELPQPVTLQLADTQLNIKQESFINADSTNVCFQMIKDKLPIHLTEAQNMLDSNGKPSLEKFYKNYNISHIGPCDQIQVNYRMNWIEILILVIACLVAIAVIISIVVLGCAAKH
uniref:Cadherin domain-containing protein n=1 Tax=Strigamia maritima TaxID=126957 RepID=T1J7N4_STRMM